MSAALRDTIEEKVPSDDMPTIEENFNISSSQHKKNGKDSRDSELGLYFPHRLNNLTIREKKRHPRQLEASDIPLIGRSGDARKLAASLLAKNRAGQKCFLAISGENGCGKTTFLSALCSELEQSASDLLVLTPHVREVPAPFSTFGELLEERFYLSENAPRDFIRAQLKGAIHSIIDNPAESDQLFDKIESFMNTVREYRNSSDCLNEEDTIETYLTPLVHLLENDLARNRILFMIDDVQLIDAASLHLLARLYAAISAPLIIVVSVQEPESLPAAAPGVDITRFDLPLLSDDEMERLVHQLFMKLAGERENIIISSELCQLVAQKSFGNPKTAKSISLHLFTADNMLPWSKSVEELKKLTVPEKLYAATKCRLEQLSPEARACLELAAVAGARFSQNLLVYLMEGESKESPFNWHRSCRSASLKAVIAQLVSAQFLVRHRPATHPGDVEFSFKRACERDYIVSTMDEMRLKNSHRVCAEWLEMHNLEANRDEDIAEHWQKTGEKRRAAFHYASAVKNARRAYFLPRCIFLLKKILLLLAPEDEKQIIESHLLIARMLFASGNFTQAYKHNRHAYMLTRQNDAYTYAARALLQMGIQLTSICSYKRALLYLTEARIIFQKYQNMGFLALTCEAISNFYLKKCQIDEAFHWAEIAHDIRRKASLDPSPALCSLSRCEYYLGNLEQACKLQTQSLSIREQNKDYIGIIESKIILANIYDRMGEASKALQIWNEALGEAQEVGCKKYEAEILNDIAEAALHIGAYKTAQSALDRCLYISKKTHEHFLLSNCYRNLSELYRVLDRPSKIYKYFRSAVNIATKTKNHEIIARLLLVSAKSYSDQTSESFDGARAERYYLAANRIFEQKKMPILHAGALLEYAEFLLENNQNIVALNSYKKSYAIFESLGIKKAAEAVSSIVDQLEGRTTGSTP